MHCRQLSRRKNARGFTLIEVIVSLVVAGILAAMLVSFMGSSLLHSSDPVVLAKNGAYLNSIMENMGADYKLQMATASLATFITNVGTEGTSQTRYSDASHPYTVVYNRRISFPLGTPVTETSTAGKILKVTITYQTLSVTALFTE